MVSHQDSGRVSWFHIVVHVAYVWYIHPSVFLFLGDNLSKCQWIFSKLSTFVCALILWISGLGLLMGKFRQFLTESSARKTSIFSFLSEISIDFHPT